jgi:polynucleotide 5'-hydroxyl-kinase GRC3/NOL9
MAPLVALIKGPKRSGKSSFGRAAVNRLLENYEKVAWLECDLGQGEFGCGGVVGIWILERPVLGESGRELTTRATLMPAR